MKINKQWLMFGAFVAAALVANFLMANECQEGSLCEALQNDVYIDAGNTQYLHNGYTSFSLTYDPDAETVTQNKYENGQWVTTNVVTSDYIEEVNQRWIDTYNDKSPTQGYKVGFDE